MLDWLSKLPPALIYTVVALLVFAEDALFVGFVLPGETAAVIGGVLANRGTVTLWGMTAVVVLAAITGDSVGFEVGRHAGERILDSRPLRGHRVRLDKARALIQRRGAEAVFLGRFVSFFRALMPPLAAIAHIPYRKFLLFNALGGLVWGVGFTLLGYFAGAAYSRVEHLVGGILAGVVALIVIIGLVMWQVRRHRTENAEEEEGEAEAEEDESEADAKTDVATASQPAANAAAESDSAARAKAEADAAAQRSADAAAKSDSAARAEADAAAQRAATDSAADSASAARSKTDADAAAKSDSAARAKADAAAQRSGDSDTTDTTPSTDTAPSTAADRESPRATDPDSDSGGDVSR